MRFASLTFAATLLLPGAPAAQAQEHPGQMAAPVPEVSSSPDIAPLERSEGLLGSIRAAAGKKDAVALRSATEAYVSNIFALQDEIGRLSRSGGAGPPDPLAIAKKIASQATDLDSLSRAVPRQLRKDVDRALAAADGLLGTLARGRSSPEPRAEPRSEPGRPAAHAH